VAARAEVTVQTHSGPLPPPEMLAAYERALPTSAERILKMAEQEQSHRHHLERTDFETRASISRVGQILAFALGISGTVGGILLAFFGKSLTGFGMFFTSLATLAGIYFYAQRGQRHQEESNKA